MKGRVLDKSFTDSDKGVEFKNYYKALVFDRPRCVVTEFYGSEPEVMFAQFGDINSDDQWEGERVIAKVRVQNPAEQFTTRRLWY